MKLPWIYTATSQQANFREPEEAAQMTSLHDIWKVHRAQQTWGANTAVSVGVGLADDHIFYIINMNTNTTH